MAASAPVRCSQEEFDGILLRKACAVLRPALEAFVKAAMRSHDPNGWIQACKEAVGGGMERYVRPDTAWDVYLLLTVASYARLFKQVFAPALDIAATEDLRMAEVREAVETVLATRNWEEHGGAQTLEVGRALAAVRSVLVAVVGPASAPAAEVALVEAAFRDRDTASPFAELDEAEAADLFARRACLAFRRGAAGVLAACRRTAAALDAAHASDTGDGCADCRKGLAACGHAPFAACARCRDLLDACVPEVGVAASHLKACDACLAAAMRRPPAFAADERAAAHGEVDLVVRLRNRTAHGAAMVPAYVARGLQASAGGAQVVPWFPSQH